MATTRGVPAEPARRQPESGSTSAGSGATPIVLSEAREATIEQLRNQVIALQRISSLGVLAGGVFHELNNALTPILNYAKLGLRNTDPAYRERALKQIVESAQRATTISRGMLGLARLGAGPVEREPADLAQLVEEVVLLVNKDLAKHRVRLEVKASGNPRARVEPAQIQQVLINLLINARQAMPQGGVVRLRVATVAAGRRAEISVSDSGVGIAPEDLRRIFEPFYSTKKAPDLAGQGGTGLGLAVCRDIIEAHHGRIRAESRPGQGSTFTIILPACAETSSSAAGIARDGAA
jgi:signal transduction histidine kinase